MMAADEQQQHAKAGGGGGGSRFAVTCGLMRQFMREQGGNGARCLALAPAVAMGGGLIMPGPGAADDAAADQAHEERAATVLELFPQQAGTLKDDEQQRKRKEPAERAPLTIFYGGKMVVFDDFPAEKADEIMQLVAGPGTAAAQNALQGQPSLTDMPLARKVSLKRFLEKRKNRLTAAEPYPAAAAASESTTKPAPAAVKKEEGDAPWLGVSSALSLS